MASDEARIYGYKQKQESHRIVRVEVISGHSLCKKDIFGASDPYVRVALYKPKPNGKMDSEIDSIDTKTKKRTLDPEWNEVFLFRVKPRENRLLFTVYDENRLTRDDFLGLVDIPLNSSYVQNSDGENYREFHLRPRSTKSRVKGFLRLKLSYHDNEAPRNSSDEVQEDLRTENDWELVNEDSSFSSVLPQGWEERQDNLGRTYYVNHANRTTQWQRPTAKVTRGDETGASSSSSSQQDRPSTSSTHHHHHQQASTSSLPPALSQLSLDGNEEENEDEGASAAAPSGAEEGAGAAEMDDAQRLFHTRRQIDNEATTNNSTTNRQQQSPNSDSWEVVEDSGGESAASSSSSSSSSSSRAREPTTDGTASPSQQAAASSDEPTATAAATATSSDANRARSNQQQQQSSTSTSSSQSRNSSRRNGSTAAGESMIAQLSEDLPAGWEVRVDNNTGRAYYVDHINRRTSWKRPTNAIESSTRGSVRGSPLSSSPAAATSSAAAATSPPSSSSSSSATNNAAGANSNRTATTSLGPLPPGWEMKTAPGGRVFFVDHNRQHTSWDDPRLTNSTRHKKNKNAAANSDIGPLPNGWEERVNTDGRIFFVDHNRQKTQWEDPRLLDPVIAGPAVPYSRDYKQKYEFFKNKLHKNVPRDMPNRFEMKIDRQHILMESFRAIERVKKPEFLKARLWIEFAREKGLDYGGVAREWFYLLSKEMFNPYYGLFEYSSTDVYTLQINPNSGFCNDEHYQWFHFIGRVAGMAVFHGKLLDAFFIRPFYKMMLGKPITLRDMESVDSEYYNSLKYILENDPESLELDFTVSEELFGQTKSTELKPGGADIKLTEQNKREYIQLVIKWRFVSRVQHQMKAFLQGFNELIPTNLLKIFDENELELLMCGLGEVDVNDWRNNTNYKGDYHANDKVIQWFWHAILSFDGEMRTRFLQFVTGTSRVPMNGFSELWGSNGPQLFTIEKWGTPDKLPRAHTCFNRLDLPPYLTFEDLRSKLIMAVENTHGFEGVD